MIYKDRIFGTVKITEPVILELLKTPTLKRLKGVDNAGYKPLWAKPQTKLGRYDYSRFAHSVGVYLLLKKYGATIKEQLAGLLHDASHSAFSHCIDYVLDSGSQKTHDYQDNIHEKYLLGTEIPQILKKYHFRFSEIINDENFPLKEKPLPDLCADRIEYSLRAAVVFHEVSPKQKAAFLNYLTVAGSRWVFKNYKSALAYARLFGRLNTIYFSSIYSAVMFNAVGECLKYALSKGYITQNDLYTTDAQVVRKIRRNLKGDARLRLLFDRMNNKIAYKNDPQDYEAGVFCKSRIIDPLCVYKGKIKRVSQVDSSWKKVLAAQSKPKEYFLKFAR